MVQQVNYEVQVQQGGRWSIHARFGGHQKEGAVEEAKQLDQLPNVEAVKVIKEVYDTDQGFHNEFIVYKSAGLKSTVAQEAEKVSSGPSAGPVQREETWLRDRDDDEVEDEYDDFTPEAPARAKRGKKGRKKASSLTGVIVKLLLVVLFSICLAAIFAWMSAELFGGTKLFGIRMVGNAESNMLIGVFVVTFLLSAVFMAVTVMKGESLEAPRPRSGLFSSMSKPKPAKPAAKKQAAPAGPQPAAPVDPLARLDEAMKGVGDYKLDEETKAAEDQAVTERLQAELNKGKQTPAEEEKPTARGVVLEAQPQAQAKKAAELEPAPLSPQAQQQKAYVMSFLNKGLGGAIDKKKLDNFNKFGVNLFLAGACEVLAQNKDLDVLSRSRILGESVQVMGFKKSHAASFADRYEEYLMADARYMQMFQAGRNAMNIYASDETAAPKLLESALAEWNKPKQKEAQAGPVTVLFTDIAGSTAMTQTLGDAGAQQVVRAHNRVVREALSANAGKEIKHTGDGIMASFAKTSDGVDAAIQMQREVALHNQHNPNLPLHLKIGLNAGEPIAEDNDLFGTTVQLSARIVDKAKADQIFVSEIVRGICAGKQYKFINRGGFPMKGFGDDVILYEVVWNEAQAAQPAQQAPAAAGRGFAPSAGAAAPQQSAKPA